MNEPKYYAADEKDEPELERIKALQEVCDPATIRRLEKIGVSKGWKCLEIGAGAGSVAQWLAERVGPKGKVVATDINPRFLLHLNKPNIEVRQHDITKDELENGYYDLVHCRLLLQHLPEPEKVLARMVTAVRPGGWLFIEEWDLGLGLLVDLIGPPGTTTMRAQYDFMKNKGIMDPFFGRKVRRLIEQMNFKEVGHEGDTAVIRGGETAARLQALSNQVMSKHLIAAGLLKQEEYERTQALFANPNFYGFGPIMFAAWGKKPTD
jgi:ubiquinone/menaquinone biosynthesis C-methylase UbiE